MAYCCGQFPVKSKCMKPIIKKPVYLDYNATTPVDPEVAAAMLPFINTNFGNHPETLPNTLSVAFDNVDAHTLASLISQEVLISTGAACHSGSAEISPVLKAIDADLKTAAGTVRISTGRFTTTEDIDHAMKVISNAVLKLLWQRYD